MTSVNTGIYSAPINSPTNTSGINGSPNSTSAAESEGLFSTPEETPSADQIERDNKRQGLEAELASLQAQKNRLEAQMKEYTNYHEKLQSKKEKLVEKQKALEEELKGLEEERKQNKADVEKLKKDYDQDNIKLLSLISKMNDKISETTDKSAQAVQEFQKKSQSATDEAMQKVQSGELKEEDVPAYIAQKTGNSSVMQAMLSSGVGVIDSLSSQVKGMVSSMSGALNSMNEKQLKIQSLTLEITSVQEEKENTEAAISVVDGEISACEDYMAETNRQIGDVDGQIASTETAIESLADESVDPSTIPDAGAIAYTPEESDSSNEDNSVPGKRNVFILPDFGRFTSKVDKVENPEPPEIVMTSGASNNPFEVASTIDYSGIKTVLDTVLEQNASSISAMKETVDANNKILAQKQQKAA